jgi:ubiquinone/menaquinone biosynthesis C-methylase UbiE
MKCDVFVERIPAPLASIYDKSARMVIKTYYGQVAEEVVSSLKEGLILDLGTGPGYLPIEIVKRATSIQIDGIDLSRTLIKIARKNAKQSGFSDRLNFMAGNANRLQFKNCTYDMVISTGMLHSLKTPARVLRECHRVLKWGGQAWIYDPARVTSQIDVRRFKASLTFPERFVYLFFPVFRKINFGHNYTREEIVDIISVTDFEDYSIAEKDEEIRIKLKK